MNLRETITAYFRPRRNVRKRKKWLREYMQHFQDTPSWAMTNRERK